MVSPTLEEEFLVAVVLSINAGFYSRADPYFYQRSGINWDLTIVNQSYEWVEKEVVFRPEIRSWQSAVRDGSNHTDSASIRASNTDPIKTARAFFRPC